MEWEEEKVKRKSPGKRGTQENTFWNGKRKQERGKDGEEGNKRVYIFEWEEEIGKRKGESKRVENLKR